MRKNEHGQILLSALTISLLVLLLSIGVLTFASVNYRLVKRSQFEVQTLGVAEAGIEHAIRQLNINGTYAGETNTSFGNGTFTITVTGTGADRTIEAAGCIPDCMSPRSQRTIRVQALVNTTNVQFFYGIQVDSGGLSMGNNSQVNGNIYSNGSIVGGNGSTITGDAVVAGGLLDSPGVEWVIHDADHFFATSSTNRDIAQSFLATLGGPLNKVAVYLGKVGNPGSNLTLRIHNDNGDQPATSTLASATINPASVGLTPSWIEVALTSPPTLLTGTKYWIVLDYGSNSSSNYWNWRKDTTDAYPSNTGKYTGNCCSGNPTWTNVGGDLAFRAWIGGAITRIEGLTIGTPTTGTARANLYLLTTVRGLLCPNLNCLPDNPPRQELPISDGVVQDWRNGAAAGGTHTGDYILTNGASASLGPKRITGKLIVDNNATLTLTGTLWVEGEVDLSNNCLIRLDPAYGSNSGVIVSDGIVDVSNNCTFQGSGDPASYIMLLTALNAPSTEVMTVDNNALGVIYYAGKGRIKFSNNAQAKEATAYGITLDNNAVITYESGLANVNFTSGPGGGWSVVAGTWQEIK